MQSQDMRWMMSVDIPLQGKELAWFLKKPETVYTDVNVPDIIIWGCA